MQPMLRSIIAAVFMVVGGCIALRGAAAAEMKSHAVLPVTAVASAEQPRDLPPLPDNLPSWLENRGRNAIAPKRASHNFAVFNIKPLALDLNAVAVGHAMAYEDLVTGRGGDLDTATFERIDRVLKNPPRFMPDEANIAPTFGRRYGVLEQVFDWTHVLHAQTIDVLSSSKLSSRDKEREIERIWDYYFRSVPYAITPLPMNMGYLDSQPYSGAFRHRYPKVNGLFWGYHWLQGTIYDALDTQTPAQQRASYEVIGKRYHGVELYRTRRSFMPMFAELSPRFAARFPHIANAFDNLHMLHDMVNDILATPWMTEAQRSEQIKRAIWLVSAAAHSGEQTGQSIKDGDWHDHRFMAGMPGMGIMKGATAELMYMDNMGWMSMGECHHCSMPLPDGKDEWRASTVSAEGWTMRVRCALCARDMAAETKGSAILRIPTERPDRLLVVFSDEEGNLRTDTPGVVFLEVPSGHAKCQDWSRAFTSRDAFDTYVAANPKYKDAKPLGFDDWAHREGGEPDTYVRPEPPPGALPPAGHKGMDMDMDDK